MRDCIKSMAADRMINGFVSLLSLDRANIVLMYHC